MEKEKVRELIAKFNAQQATQAEIDQIEKLIESGSIELSELHGFNDIDVKVSKLDFASPSSHLDDRFYHMLAKEQASRTSFSWRGFFSWPELAPKLALASVMLVIGVGVGYIMRPAVVSTTNSTEMAELGRQMSEMKEMMMLTLLEKESASERLKAVSLTQDMDKASEKVTGALIQTLNNDENVNVRLAALDALRPYLANSGVREELIRSIAQQDSPLVQVALADMMAAAQVKSSVKELEKILKNEKTPSDVKNRIQKSIDILI